MLKPVYTAAYLAISIGFLRSLRRKLVSPRPHRTTGWVLYVQDADDEQLCLSLAYVDRPEALYMATIDRMLPSGFTSRCVRADRMPPIPSDPQNPFRDWMTGQLMVATRKLADLVPGIYPI